MAERHESSHQKWAQFRFSVVGGLLAAPPLPGELRTALEALASTTWIHPISRVPARFGLSTIERWYYGALRAGIDPVGALRRKVRSDAGTHPSLSEAQREAIAKQHSDHRRWNCKLHYDNLGARARRESTLGTFPSYSVVRRYMREQGLRRAKGKRTPKTAGAEQALTRFEKREVRSYEVEYVGALYHSDFHECSRQALEADGRWVRPHLYGCLDDCSRLACHLQWYLTESAETHTHGTEQAFMKRGLPRGMMTDRGPAEMAAEATEGLARLGVPHEPTLPYSPHQNAKEEVLWASVEGRLMPMLEGVEPLTLALLNEATQAWVAYDYNREVHSEIGQTPLERWLAGPSVVRDCPSPQALRDAFRRTETRSQRRSDGTVLVGGRRFEVPSRYGHLDRLVVRYATWDLSNVHLIDPRTNAVLCRLWPLDKTKNAEGRRARRDGPAPESGTLLPPPASGMAPLLEEYMQQYAAQGLPPAYLPLPERDRDGDDDDRAAGKAVRT